jgi:outer membrane protein TolC
MENLRRIALFAFVLSCSAAALATPAYAQAKSYVFSLDEAIRRAEEAAPQAVLARQAVREAAAKRVGATLRIPANPRLAMELRPAVTGGALLGDMGYGGTLDLPFDLGPAPSARGREAQSGVAVAEADLATERRQARGQVAALYIQCNTWAARVAEFDALLQIAERILRASITRSAAGASGDVDEATARSELSVLQSQRQGATRQYDAYLMQMRSLLDLPHDAPLVLTSPLGAPKMPLGEQVLIARALNQKPELARARAKIAALMATSERLRGELFPKLSVFLGVDAAPVSPVFAQLGLSVELPFAQRNQQARAVTETQTQAEQTRLEFQLRQIVRDVAAARSSYESRRSELSVLTEQGLPAAERALELVLAGWLAGRFDIFRVSAAARDVARLRALHMDALEATLLDYAALEFQVGGFAQ